MKRPVGITILAILAIIGGVLQLLGGLSFLGITALAVPGLEAAGLAEGFGLGAGTVLIIMSVLSVVFGIGALMLRSWAWTLGVVLFGISLVANLVIMFMGGLTVSVVVSALIAAGIIAYLYTDSVRTAFGHEHGFTRSTGGTPVSHA
jgi:hypothetical protein